MGFLVLYGQRPICCVINALQSSVRNEILVENKQRSRISPVGTIYLVAQLGFKYIMPTAFMFVESSYFYQYFVPTGRLEKHRVSISSEGTK